MTLVKCPECGKEVSDKAMVCPGCGNPLIVATETPDPAVVYECKECKSQFDEHFTVCPKCGCPARNEERAAATAPAPTAVAGDKSKMIKIGACVAAAVVVLCLVFSMFGGKGDMPSSADNVPVSSSKVSSDPIIGKWEGVSVFDYDTKKVSPLPANSSFAEFKKDGTFTMNMNSAKLNGTWRTMKDTKDTNFDDVYMLSAGSGTAAGIQDGKLMIKIENYMETFEKVR